MSDINLHATVNVNLGAVVDGRLTVGFNCVGDSTHNVNFDLTTDQWKAVAQAILKRVWTAEEFAP